MPSEPRRASRQEMMESTLKALKHLENTRLPTHFKGTMRFKSLDFSNPENLGKWIQPKLDPKAAAPSPQGVLDWVQGVFTKKISTEYDLSPSYGYNRVGLKISFEPDFLSGAFAYFGWIPYETQIIPLKNAGSRESWHNYIEKLGGYYFAIGFQNTKQKDKFVKILEQDVFPSGPRVNIIKVLPRTLYIEGTALDENEKPEVLLLIPPKLFQTILYLYGPSRDRSSLLPPGVETPEEKGTYWIPANFEDLLGLSNYQEPTTRGTVYYFRDKKVVGYQNSEGRFFKLNPKAAPQPTPFASHAEILRRQWDPFGIGGIEQERLSSQLDGGGSAVGDLIKKLLPPSPWYDIYPTPLLNPEEFSSMAMERLEQIQSALTEKKGLIDIEKLFLKIRMGIQPWIQSPSGKEATKYLRFVWIKGGKPGESFFAINENLLHWQMIVLLIDDQIRARHHIDMHRDRDFIYQLKNVFRGGLLEIKYGTSGDLQSMRVVDGKFSAPVWNADEKGPIVMTSQEKGQLIRELKKSIAKK